MLEKNPDYNWGPDWMENKGKPIIDRIVMRVIREESTRRMELEAGNVHILRNVPASFVEELAGNEDVEMIRGVLPSCVILLMPVIKNLSLM